MIRQFWWKPLEREIKFLEKKISSNQSELNNFNNITGDELDFQLGMNMGWKISKNFGVFVDGEYTKFWDTRIFNTSFGINYTFK